MTQGPFVSVADLSRVLKAFETQIKSLKSRIAVLEAEKKRRQSTDRRKADAMKHLPTETAGLMQAIIDPIVERHGVRLEDVRGRSRKGYLVLPRSEACRALREYGFPTPAIGHFMGYRDHTTILHLTGDTAKAKSRKAAKSA